MREIETLLRLLTERVPPEAAQKHALTLNEHSGLNLHLSTAKGWQLIRLEPSDLAKSGETLTNEIVGFIQPAVEA